MDSGQEEKVLDKVTELTEVIQVWNLSLLTQFSLAGGITTTGPAENVLRCSIELLFFVYCDKIVKVTW